MVGKINTYKIQYFRIIERCTHLPVEIPSTPKKEDNRCVYEGKNAFLWLPTGFGKLVGYEMLSCVLDHKQSELGTGLSSYAVVLLVLPLVSLTIAKFTTVSEHYFVIAYLLALYIYYLYEYLVRILFHVDKLGGHYNFSENGYACASS